MPACVISAYNMAVPVTIAAVATGLAEERKNNNINNNNTKYNKIPYTIYLPVPMLALAPSPVEPLGIGIVPPSWQRRTKDGDGTGMSLRVFFGNVAIPICFHNMLGTTMRCHLIQMHGSYMLYANKIENPIEDC